MSSTFGILAAAGGNVAFTFENLASNWARYPPLYPKPAVRWPQEAIERAFCQLFPDQVFCGFQFPFIEDVINAAPFTSYLEWREDRHMSVGGPLPPLMIPKSQMRVARSGTGVQLSVMYSVICRMCGGPSHLSSRSGNALRAST